jgi:hypothetical protein
LEFINSNVKVTSFFKTKSTPSFQLLFWWSRLLFTSKHQFKK